MDIGDIGNPAGVLLACVVLPLWLLAGLADWMCHRASAIEHSSGVAESRIHVLLALEIGAPLLLALWLEPNAFLFALATLGIALHAVTNALELRFVTARRDISPAEQQVHGLLEVLPLAALLLLASSHWPQFSALFGAGGEAPVLVPVRRHEPLPSAAIAAVLLAILMFNALPLAEELWRCHRARRAAAPPTEL
jgi:hypothetical protein